MNNSIVDFLYENKSFDPNTENNNFLSIWYENRIRELRHDIHSMNLYIRKLDYDSFEKNHKLIAEAQQIIVGMRASINKYQLKLKHIQE